MDIDQLASSILVLTENASPEVLDLFLKNQPLAYRIANLAAHGYQYHSNGTMGALDREDFAQEALLALYKAAQTYDPSRGFTFSTFAHALVTNAVRSLVKAGRAKKRAIVSTDLDSPLEGSGDDSDEGGISRLDTIGDPAAVGVEDRKDSLAVLQNAIAQVTSGKARDRKILTDLLTHGDSFNFRSVADELNISATYVQDVINKYTPKLKKLLNSKGLGGYDDRGTMVPLSQTRPGEYSPRRKKSPFRKDVELAANESIAIARFMAICERICARC